MNANEALEEARRRWGPEAVVKEFHATGDSRHEFSVLGKRAIPRAGGFGASWEAAFADADRRANEN